MNVRAIVALAGAGVLAASLRGSAHHSFDAEFDRNKPITVTGTVTKVEWTNPHARFYLDVRDASGKVVNWDFELGSAAGMMRRGWTRNSLKYGDVVTVMGYAAKNAPYVANAYSVTLGDGRKLFAGSSIGGQPSVNSDERR
ncbi:MAG TPA: DUF6152 family protein [Vicinamibacterales bacterium]|nr:DUF6152 family protein [Vicinamibacterales bacterium]